MFSVTAANPFDGFGDGNWFATTVVPSATHGDTVKSSDLITKFLTLPAIAALSGHDPHTGREPDTVWTKWLALPDLSSHRPTGSPKAVTGVVPAESWNRVDWSEASSQKPLEPSRNRLRGSPRPELSIDNPIKGMCMLVHR